MLPEELIRWILSCGHSSVFIQKDRIHSSWFIQNTDFVGILTLKRIRILQVECNQAMSVSLAHLLRECRGCAQGSWQQRWDHRCDVDVTSVQSLSLRTGCDSVVLQPHQFLCWAGWDWLVGHVRKDSLYVENVTNHWEVDSMWGFGFCSLVYIPVCSNARPRISTLSIIFCNPWA